MHMDMKTIFKTLLVSLHNVVNTPNCFLKACPYFCGLNCVSIVLKQKSL